MRLHPDVHEFSRATEAVREATDEVGHFLAVLWCVRGGRIERVPHLTFLRLQSWKVPTDVTDLEIFVAH
jgi:hypothetical protein